MRKAALIPVSLALLLLIAAAPASAQDAPAPTGESAEAAAPAPEPDPPAVRGEKVEVHLRSGVVLTGILKGGRYEIMRGTGYVAVKDEETPGAGVRIFYTLGLDGFVFIPFEAVKSIEYPGQMSVEEGKKLARVMRDDRRKAERDRDRAVREIAAKKAAFAAALRGEQEEEGAEEEAGFEVLPEAPEVPVHEEPGPENLARQEEMDRLLLRFPPPEWKPSRFIDLKRRAVKEDIFPNEEEREFVKHYDLWLEAYRIWEAGK